jgi:hypothetical protein
VKRIWMFSIGRVNTEFFPGWKKIKQRRISFVLGYFRMYKQNIILTACVPLSSSARVDIQNKYKLKKPICDFWQHIYMVNSSSSIVLQFAHLQILLNIMSLLLCVQDENNLQSRNMYYILQLIFHFVNWVLSLWWPMVKPLFQFTSLNLPKLICMVSLYFCWSRF